jgi:hypothetical protein
MPKFESLEVYTTKEIELYKTLLNESATISVAASGTGIVTITVPSGKRYFIKQINVTKGANTTIAADGVLIDEAKSKQTASFDSESIFGTNLTADTSISVTGTNAGTAAENLTIQVIGYIMNRESGLDS